MPRLYFACQAQQANCLGPVVSTAEMAASIQEGLHRVRRSPATDLQLGDGFPDFELMGQVARRLHVDSEGFVFMHVAGVSLSRGDEALPGPGKLPPLCEERCQLSVGFVVGRVDLEHLPILGDGLPYLSLRSRLLGGRKDSKTVIRLVALEPRKPLEPHALIPLGRGRASGCSRLMK